MRLLGILPEARAVPREVNMAKKETESAQELDQRIEVFNEVVTLLKTIPVYNRPTVLRSVAIFFGCEWWDED